MKSFEHSVSEIDKLFDMLIAVAGKLADVSLQTISENDILSLQSQQEDLLNRIAVIDQYLQSNYKREILSTVHDRFHAKLEEFQKLNKKFIGTLSSTYGLIQFESYHPRGNLEEGEKIPYLPPIRFYKTGIQNPVKEL